MEVNGSGFIYFPESIDHPRSKDSSPREEEDDDDFYGSSPPDLYCASPIVVRMLDLLTIDRTYSFIRLRAGVHFVLRSMVATHVSTKSKNTQSALPEVAQAIDFPQSSEFSPEVRWIIWKLHAQSEDAVAMLHRFAPSLSPQDIMEIPCSSTVTFTLPNWNFACVLTSV